MNMPVSSFTEPLDIQDGDVIHFLGDRRLEVSRKGQLIHRLFCHDYDPGFPPLRKKASPEKAEPKERDSSDIPPGAKWITVNPHDIPGAGHPILVMPSDDGSMTVIGGAGGKLNMLKLRGVGDEATWKERAKQRKEEKKQAEAERQASLSDDEKEEEKETKKKLEQAKQTHRRENAAKTLEALEHFGVDHGLSADHKLALQQTPEPGDPPEKIKEWQKHVAEATKTIRAIHQAYEHKLTTDHEARAAAQLGDGINHVVQNRAHSATNEDGDALSEMVNLGNGQWLVKDRDGEAETFDSWEDAANHHLGNVQQAEQETGAGRSQHDEFYSPSAWVPEPKDEQLPEGFEFKPEAAIAIAQLSEERKAGDRAVNEIEKKRSPIEALSSAVALRVQEVNQADVLDKLEDKAKTLEDAWINSNFLDMVEEGGDPKKLRNHLQVGGYGSLAAIASDVLKQNPLSRELVDALGHSEASKVLAHIMRQHMTSREFDAAALAIAQHHADTQSRIAKATTAQVQPMMNRLKHLHEQMLMIDELAGGELSATQQIQMDALAYDARTLNETIQKTIGNTLGAMQASAAMVAAVEGKGRSLTFVGEESDKLLEKIMPEDEETGEIKPGIFDAYGLSDEDFSFHDSPEGRVLKIGETGLNKLAIGYSHEDKEAYERAVAIKRGEMDEEEWLPAGFSHYQKTTFDDALQLGNQFDVHFDALEKLASSEGQTMSLFGGGDDAPELSDEDIESSMRSYIGSRVANGEHPLEVMQTIRSPEFYLNSGLDPYSGGGARVQAIASDMIGRVAGSYNISDQDVIKAFQAMADDEAVKQRKSRQTDDLETLHQQNLDPEDESVTEALHLSLASFPLGKTVFKDWGDLTHHERKALRDYAITDVLGEELKDPPRKGASTAISEDVAEDQYDLFGNKISAAEALGTQDEEQELSQWKEFSKLMGGDAKAYAAVRDHLKGKFLHRFANAHGQMSGSPLLIGGETLTHVDKLLMAKLPPEQRQEMLDFMAARDASDRAKVRSRSGGKFASEMEGWLAKYEEIKGSNRQISLLASDTGRSTPQSDYQRTTIGKNAEAALHQAAQKVIPNFEQINSATPMIEGVHWGKGTPHATKKRALDFLKAQKRVGLHFGAGCVHGSTMLRCEKTGVEKSFFEWWLSGDRPWVSALNEKTGLTEVVQSSPVFLKAYEGMYRVTLENGSSIVVTAGHRFLSRDRWVRLGDLGVGDAIAVVSYGDRAPFLEGSQTFGAEHFAVSKVCGQTQRKRQSVRLSSQSKDLHQGRVSLPRMRQACSFDLVRNIEEVGNHFVFDITVPMHHNYLAHGIFNHNSGKSSIMLGCFSQLHSEGKIRKGVVALPSSILGQFVGEAVTFLKAGTYNYSASLNMSREDRLKALADPNQHIFITTRESLSNDLMHLVEKHQGIDSDTFRAKPESEQRDLILKAAKAEGIDPENLLLCVDEAHDVTSRKGVDPSKRSLALNQLGGHSQYYIQATADQIKNDLSESYNFLHSVAPDKFNDMNKFLAEYGGDTPETRRALQRLLAPYSYSAATKPFKKVKKPDGTSEMRQVRKQEFQPTIKVNAYIASERQKILDDIQLLSDFQSDRRAELKQQHGPDYEPTTEDFNTAWEREDIRAALDRIGSEDTWHSKSDEEKASAIGGQIRAVGGLKRTALWRLYHRTPIENNPKMQWTVDHAISKFKDEGKPSVIFNSSSQAAEMMVKELEKRGMRVAYIHGGLDGKGKDAQRLKFQPTPPDQPQADILVCTDAARTGVNLTRGKVLIHGDVPLTGMAYEQRSARIFRLKQDEDVEIHTPMLDAPEERVAWQRMRRKQKLAGPLKGKAELIDDTGLAAKIQENLGGAIAPHPVAA